jgi:hypothetical protein
LRVEAVRNPLDVIVLEEGEIEVHQSGSNECIAAQVTAKCNGIRNLLSALVSELLPSLMIRRAFPTGVPDVDVTVPERLPFRVCD